VSQHVYNRQTEGVTELRVTCVVVEEWRIPTGQALGVVPLRWKQSRKFENYLFKQATMKDRNDEHRGLRSPKVCCILAYNVMWVHIVQNYRQAAVALRHLP